MKKGIITILVLGGLFLALPLYAQTLGVDLTWDDNSSNEDGFVIERATNSPQSTGTFIEVGRVGRDIKTYSESGVQPGSCYRVAAFNKTGQSKYSNVACLGLPPDGAPSNLTLDIKWTIKAK